MSLRVGQQRYRLQCDITNRCYLYNISINQVSHIIYTVYQIQLVLMCIFTVSVPWR